MDAKELQYENKDERRIMTREEAIAHARFVRSKTKDASMICLDGEVIDAILSNPWHKASEERPGKGQLVLISNPAIQFAIYDGLFRPVIRIGRRFEVADEHVFVESKYWMEIPEIPEG